MADWQRIEEDGVVYWVHEELGNIMEVGGRYIAMAPLVAKLGPFTDLEKARNALQDNKLKEIVEEYNLTLEL